MKNTKSAKRKNVWTDRKWRALRFQTLVNQPNCRICGKPAKHVDHIKSVEKHPELKYEPRNLQPLCHSCHSRKTYYIDGGLGFKRGKHPIKGYDADGWPTDPDHPWNAGN